MRTAESLESCQSCQSVETFENRESDEVCVEELVSVVAWEKDRRRMS